MAKLALGTQMSALYHQPIPKMAPNGCRGLVVIINIRPMFTGWYPMLGKESNVANPQKVANLMKMEQSFSKNELATLL
jgi:hypothetical protein